MGKEMTNTETVELMLSDSRMWATLYLHDIISVTELMNEKTSSLDLKEECINYLRNIMESVITELRKLGYSNCTISNIIDDYGIGTGYNYVENDFNGVDDNAVNYFSKDSVTKRYDNFLDICRRCP